MRNRECAPYEPRSPAPAAGSVPVTALVLTLNEEENLKSCLESLGWCSQVIIIDSGSTDRTVEIAKKYGAHIVHQAWLGYGAQREFARTLAVIEHRWILAIDADEWISTRLASEIASVITKNEFAAYAFRKRLIFMGRWIRHCGWYSNSWTVALYQRDLAHYDPADIVGERAHVRGRVGRLRNDLVDENRRGLAQWIFKHVSYAELEARRREDLPSMRIGYLRGLDGSTVPMGRRVTKELLRILPGKPLLLFLYMYVLRCGFLDGREGLIFCIFHAQQEWMTRIFAERLRVDGQASR